MTESPCRSPWTWISARATAVGVFAAPEIFSFDDDDYLLYEATPDDGLRADAEKAAASCPVRAITVAAP